MVCEGLGGGFCGVVVRGGLGDEEGCGEGEGPVGEVRHGGGCVGVSELCACVRVGSSSSLRGVRVG